MYFLSIYATAKLLNNLSTFFISLRYLNDSIYHPHFGFYTYHISAVVPCSTLQVSFVVIENLKLKPQFNLWE